MSTVAEVLKTEITRLARKEIKRELLPLRKQIASQRSAIAALRQQLADVARQVKQRSRATSPTPAAAPATRARFSAKGLKSLRTKLGLSAANIGHLIGVSGQTVYNWEAGTSRPKPEQLALLRDVRGLSKKALLEKLDSMKG